MTGRTIYTIANAEDRAREHFPMFQIPDLETRRRLTVGMMAKLIFVVGDDPDRRERLWVKITRVDHHTLKNPVLTLVSHDSITYVGVVVNDPLYFDEHDLDRGDEVWFGPEHVTEWDVSA